MRLTLLDYSGIVNLQPEVPQDHTRQVICMCEAASFVFARLAEKMTVYLTVQCLAVREAGLAGVAGLVLEQR